MKKKNLIETKWKIIKTKSETKNYNLEELDYLTCELIAYLSKLTVDGVTEIDGVSIDLYKDRVWWVVEKIGLLPEYRGEDLKDILDDNDEDFVDEEDIREKDDEYNDDEFDFKINKILINSLEKDWLP